MDSKKKTEIKPVKRLKMVVNIDKDLMSFVKEQVKRTKSPSPNRWVNNVLRDLWAGSEK